MKNRKFQLKDFTKIKNTYEIDTSNTPNYVQESILKIIWK